VSGQKPREIAARILEARPGGEFVEDRFERGMGETRLEPADRRLCQELVYGTVRWQATLDWLIARKTGNRPQKPRLQNLLRLGLYQIFWLERIPNHAAVHETVEQAKRNGMGAQAGFVNALLRGYLREADVTRKLLQELKSKDPALGYSHPGWLVERWQKRWGTESAAQLMAWNNQPPKTFARVNTLKADPGKLLVQWRDEGVEYDFVCGDWFEENLVFELKSHPPLARLPSFQQGLFYLQDPSTLLAVRELGPEPGENVLDVCAAPGGKLTYAAQLMRNEGRLVAEDLSPERMELVRENCARLGVKCVVEDGGTGIASGGEAEDVTKHPITNRAAGAGYDRVLLDAPCSNTGVMRRRVDLRWRLRLEEIQRLRRTQLELLQRAAGKVKSGGILVYSTCSLEPEENQEVIAEWLGKPAGFKLETERELSPFSDKVDGAYVARLRREG
jgi:16S rRNA (cytosine967-C5)-methyltransferase